MLVLIGVLLILVHVSKLVKEKRGGTYKAVITIKARANRNKHESLMISLIESFR